MDNMKRTEEIVELKAFSDSVWRKGKSLWSGLGEGGEEGRRWLVVADHIPVCLRRLVRRHSFSWLGTVFSHTRASIARTSSPSSIHHALFAPCASVLKVLTLERRFHRRLVIPALRSFSTFPTISSCVSRAALRTTQSECCYYNALDVSVLCMI